MKVVIIKYNAGNIKSVQNAVERLGFECEITDDIEQIKKADKVIFPGVGEASSAMKYLKEKELDVVIKQLKQPVLGICLGLQLLCKSSEENNTQCLGIFDSEVKLFPPKDKVPHIGWNDFDYISGSLFKGVNAYNDVYYVHSYYAQICKQTVAVCNYILPFSAAIQQNNFYATQFHPEKSASVGEQILKNFLEL
ncbi:imidazole glycerol phosphate synthase subunit HisH [Tenacibaculum sp. IB213877]|uniref:imidazole glycerol phosphate synthase subunit HisH n=1 Tax=Tenacibaculum sp. IB213877 TaxID=3097351 RepID=UPI002A59F9E7|nr:imidazole glycerol phosphate synthase subunit HisH [Tenacibaculum sp. IB213877]MDY0779557.1 imidazole glycerol phosphate synthase subunit HisH [Tenacibaculum sp. IB213877]